jgi:magnesium transporter
MKPHFRTTVRREKYVRLSSLTQGSCHDEEARLQDGQAGKPDVQEPRREGRGDTAADLMIGEYLVYPQDARVEDVLRDLRDNAQKYAHYDVQYAYVQSAEGRLVGVLRLRDLLLAPADQPIVLAMILDPIRVSATARLERLKRLFDRRPLFGIPVVDDDGQLVGVVLRAQVEEAFHQRAHRTLLALAGIIGGEESRDMPFGHRLLRRLSWLTMNVFLNVIAASVIARNQSTLSAAISLAVFLPIISDMSGCSGNQSVAVTMRELALGLSRPRDFWRILAKEGSVGLVNGLVLGLLLGAIAWLWKGNPMLGLVVGGALAVNTVLAVCLGGSIPLLLRRLGQDPALASGPILTTLTDACGFFLVLTFAQAVLPWLVG